MTTKTTGTGLGLAISHAIIRAHGGEIKVESPSGAKFIISLPIPTLSEIKAGHDLEVGSPIRVKSRVVNNRQLEVSDK